jgi:cysteine synthase
MGNTLERLEKLQNFIGNTPTIRFQCKINGKNVTVLAKYEANNFTGSIKDRMAYQIIKAAHMFDKISPGDIIVEATSGNTGISFAAIGAYLGHPVQIYMPNWLSEERKRLLRFYGADLFEISAKDGGFMKCIDLAAKKSKKNGYFCPKQFDNTWNIMAHQKTTAPELENTLKSNKLGNLDVFIAGVGTGGTIMGFYHYFSELLHNKNYFKAFPILPDKNEDEGHRIEGIGDSFVPRILDLEALEPVLRVKDSDAINIARQVNKLGLSVGISSGANLFGAIIKASELPASGNVATVLPDGNKKYLTTDLCSEGKEPLSEEIKILDYELIS